MTQVERRGSGLSRCFASWQGGLWVVSLEPLGGVFVDQPFVCQPLHGPDPCPGIPQRVPGRDQVGVLLVQRILEAPECALALQRAAQALPYAAVADAVRGSTMSWYQM